jgi:uncharacterized Zn-finger protein
MIKLRAEWHHTCPDCGTRLVVDLLADANGFRVCPWCGRVENNGHGPSDPSFRDDVCLAIGRLEEQTNSTLTRDR